MGTVASVTTLVAVPTMSAPALAAQDFDDTAHQQTGWPAPVDVDAKLFALWRERQAALVAIAATSAAATAAELQLSTQKRARISERRMAKLSTLERQHEAACDRFTAIQGEIKELSPATPNVIAGVVLDEIYHEAVSVHERLTFPQNGTLVLAEAVLTALRPQLRGPIAEAVGELLDNPDKPIGEMSFHRYLLRDVVAA